MNPMSLIDEDTAALLFDRLRLLTDRAEIVELCDKYVRHMDRDRDHDAWLTSVFTEDIEMTFPMGTFSGLEGLIGFQEMARTNFAGSHHLSGNYGVELHSDTARVRAHLIAVHVAGGDPGTHFDIGGHYDAEAVRTADGWRFRRLDFGLVWSSGPPPGGEHLA